MTCCVQWGITEEEWAKLPKETRTNRLAHLWATREPRTTAQQQKDAVSASLQAAKLKTQASRRPSRPGRR